RECDLAGEYFVTVLAHILFDPRLQIGIGQIGNAETRLIPRTIRDERMRGIAGHRTRRLARRRFKEWPCAVQSDPTGHTVRAKRGWILLWQRGTGDERRDGDSREEYRAM